MFSNLYVALSLILDIVIMAKAEFFDKIYGIPLFILVFTGLYFSFFVLHVAVFALFGLTIDKENPPENIDNIYRKIGFDTLKVFLDTLHVKVHVEGMEKVPDGKFSLVCNHLTIYDPMIFLLLFKKYKLAFVSKKENMDIPFVGRYMAAVGCVALDREDTSEALKTINKAANYIKTGKANMGIYPEGWVNKSDEVLLPFRNGAFRVARKSDSPLLVTTIRGTKGVKKGLFRRKVDVYVDVLEVIPKEEVKKLPTKQIGEKVHEIMYNALSQNKKLDEE